MVGAATETFFDELGLRLLHDVDARHRYAYGYLSAAVAGVLEGRTDLAWLRAVLDALTAELGGEAR